MTHEENLSLGDELAAGLRYIYNGYLKGYSGDFSEETVDRVRMISGPDRLHSGRCLRDNHEYTEECSSGESYNSRTTSPNVIRMIRFASQGQAHFPHLHKDLHPTLLGFSEQ